MIRNTFAFLEGIGKTREQGLWRQGVENWNDFLQVQKVKGISKERKKDLDVEVEQAKQRLISNDERYFHYAIPFGEQWRLYEHFKDDAVYLDIETNGYYGNITMVGLFDGIEN